MCSYYIYMIQFMCLNVSNLRCDPSICMIILNDAHACLSKRATILNQNKY